MPKIPILRRSVVILWVSILCAASMVYYHLGLFLPRALAMRSAQGFGNGYSVGADFYPIWLTAREGLLHHRDPYSPATTRQIQIDLFGSPLEIRNPAAPPDSRAFANPAFALVLFWPLARLPFSVVRTVLALILPVVTALGVVLWLRALRVRAGPGTLASLTLLTLSSYAVLEGLYAEQAGLFVWFLLATSLAMLGDGKLFLAGNLLSLTLIKPQMMVLVAAYLLLWCFYDLRARGAFLGGFLLMSSLLAGSSLLIWPGWIPEWLQVLSTYRQYSTPPLVSYLLGARIGPRFGPLLIAAILVGAIAIAVGMRDAIPASARFSLTVSLLLAITVISVLPGHAVYDHVLLLPGILWIALSWRSFASATKIVRLLLVLGALALFWQWACAVVVIAARPMLSPQIFDSIIMLPIRTAASIPFAVVAILGMAMWRAMDGRGLRMRNDESREMSRG